MKSQDIPISIDNYNHPPEYPGDDYNYYFLKAISILLTYP